MFSSLTKNISTELNELSKGQGAFDKQDNIGEFEERELRNRNPKFGKFNRPNLYYPIYTNPNSIDERIQSLIFNTLESIGSGFYAYSWDEKKYYYSKARSHAGGAMALMVIHESILDKWKKTNFELEEVLIPALGALIKTVEKKSLKIILYQLKR